MGKIYTQADHEEYRRRQDEQAAREAEEHREQMGYMCEARTGIE